MRFPNFWLPKIGAGGLLLPNTRNPMRYFLKPFCCLLLALAFLIPVPGMTAPTPSLYERMSLKGVNRDELALFDINALPLDTILKEQNDSWVLAKLTPLTPQQKKNHFIVLVDPATGQTALSPGADFRPTEQGDFAVLSSLNEKKSPSEKYDFPIPFVYNGPAYLKSHISYSPFRVGGYAICQVTPNAEGKDRYSPVYVVPAEWQAFVVPAFAFCRANPTLFSDSDTHMTAARRTKLTALLTSPNPYLAAFACRTLTRAAAVDPETVDMALLQADPFRQAVMTYLLLANVPQQDNATALVVEGSIHAVTNAADTLDDLNGIALGIGAALETTGGTATWGARDDLAEARKRLAPDGAADSYVSALLHGHERTDK